MVCFPCVAKILEAHTPQLEPTPSLTIANRKLPLIVTDDEFCSNSFRLLVIIYCIPSSIENQNTNYICNHRSACNQSIITMWKRQIYNVNLYVKLIIGFAKRAHKTRIVDAVHFLMLLNLWRFCLWIFFFQRKSSFFCAYFLIHTDVFIHNSQYAIFQSKIPSISNVKKWMHAITIHPY